MCKYVKVHVVSLHFADTPTKLGTSSEREVLCVSLRKDPKLGLGKERKYFFFKVLNLIYQDVQ